MGPAPFPFPPRHGLVHNGHWTAVLGPPSEPQDRPCGICGKPGHRFRRYGRSRRCHPHRAGFACAAFHLKPAFYRSSFNFGKFEPLAFRYFHVDPGRYPQRVAHSDTDALPDTGHLHRAHHIRNCARSACSARGTRRSGSTRSPSRTAGRSTRCPSSAASSSSSNKLGSRGDPWRFLPKRRRWNARNFRRRQCLHLRRQGPGQEWPLPLELIRRARWASYSARGFGLESGPHSISQNQAVRCLRGSGQSL